MNIKVHLASFKKTTVREYATRFIFGGLITACTGLIAHKYGPAIGGLFLAFPAVLPAGLTLVQHHEADREKSHGAPAPQRSRSAAGVTAAGAAIGSIGLFAFGGVVWGLAAHLPSLETLLLATLAWTFVSGLGWIIRQKL